MKVEAAVAELAAASPCLLARDAVKGTLEAAPSDLSGANNRAATTIQAGWHGYRARKELDDGLVGGLMAAKENDAAAAAAADNDGGKVDYSNPRVQCASVAMRDSLASLATLSTQPRPTEILLEDTSTLLRPPL